MARSSYTRRHVIIFTSLLGLVAFMVPGRSHAEDSTIVDNDVLVRLDNDIAAVKRAKNTHIAVMRTLLPMEQVGQKNLQKIEHLLVAARACLKEGKLPAKELAVNPLSYKWVQKQLENEPSLGRPYRGETIVELLAEINTSKGTDVAGRKRPQATAVVKHVNGLRFRALLIMDGQFVDIKVADKAFQR